MLRIGQKVQVSKNAKRYYHTGKVEVFPIAGEITYIATYVGKRMSIKNGVIKEFYTTALSTRSCSRDMLYPIDDEPCNSSFLEDFKELINEQKEEVKTAR